MIKNLKRKTTALLFGAVSFGAMAEGEATNPISDIFGMVDLSTVVTGIVALAGFVIAANMAFKGITLAKRAIKAT